MAGIINLGMGGILECVSQKLATSLGSKQQGPGPQSLGKNLPESQGQAGWPGL